MIYITCGTCGTSKGYKTAADGSFTLPASEERRLVLRGVAAYVTKPIMETTHSDKTQSNSPDPEQMPRDTTGEKTPSDAPPAPAGEPSDSMSVSTLERMTKADLERMARDMGVDISSAKNNRERAELIAAAEAEEGGEDSPELEDEDIVR